MSNSTLSALLLILACSAPSIAAEDAPLEMALGAKVFAENCARCHEAPEPSFRDGRAWRAVSLHMRVFAYISRDEQHQVLAFLRSQNTAGIATGPTESTTTAVVAPTSAAPVPVEVKQ